MTFIPQVNFFNLIFLVIFFLLSILDQKRLMKKLIWSVNWELGTCGPQKIIIVGAGPATGVMYLQMLNP